MPQFTSQHYTSIAQVLHKVKQRVRDGEIGAAMADFAIEAALSELFENDNPRFDKEKFYQEVYLQPCLTMQR